MLLIIKMGYNIKIKLVIEIRKLTSFKLYTFFLSSYGTLSGWMPWNGQLFA